MNFACGVSLWIFIINIFLCYLQNKRRKNLRWAKSKKGSHLSSLVDYGSIWIQVISLWLSFLYFMVNLEFMSSFAFVIQTTLYIYFFDCAGNLWECWRENQMSQQSLVCWVISSKVFYQASGIKWVINFIKNKTKTKKALQKS
jgi:hypothetical protein